MDDAGPVLKDMPAVGVELAREVQGPPERGTSGAQGQTDPFCACDRSGFPNTGRDLATAAHQCAIDIDPYQPDHASPRNSAIAAASSGLVTALMWFPGITL